MFLPALGALRRGAAVAAAAATRRAAVTAAPYSSAMRDAVHGVRPPDGALDVHVRALLAAGQRHRALIAAVSSLPLHAAYPLPTLVALLDAFAAGPVDPPCAAAVRQVA